MRKQRGDIEIVLIVALLVLFLFVGGCSSYVSCGSRWEGSGLETSWGPIQGCKVRLKDGRWLPEDRVREIDINGDGK